jgi:hypothetical protein
LTASLASKIGAANEQDSLWGLEMHHAVALLSHFGKFG